MPAPPAEPSGPPVKLFTTRFVVKVREAPAKEALRIGYLRGGAVVQATTAAPLGYDKCRKGWYGLTTGGFLCSTLDALPFVSKRLPERQSLQPDLAARLPYPYGYSRRRNTPMYRRLPTDEEAALYEGYRIPGLPPPDAGSALAEPPSPEPEAAPLAPQAAGAPGSGEIDPLDSDVPTLASLQGDQSSALVRRMERGFYVSLDREMRRGARGYWRTQSNGFIPAQGLMLVKGSAFHGVDLKQQSIALPIGFVLTRKASTQRLSDKGQLKRTRPPEYHFMFPIAALADIRGTHYYVAADGLHYRDGDVTRIAAREKPSEVGVDERWIDIDLSLQTLVAYVGAEPVYATLISSGRVRDELDPLKNFETPKGAFRITSKHLTANMDGDHALDGPYSIEDVPYVMYFELAYALHAAFWHDAFGRPRSHGCINLAPTDARWLFEFAAPPLPVPWHGVYPRPSLPGTRLYIHGTTPQG